jgi:two-component system, NtrC family, response regulator AtoC
VTKSADDVTVERSREGGEGALCLVITAVGIFRTHPLPDEGDVTIGRGSANGIRVDHRSVSRQHAILHIGKTLEIEDLDSANGIRVRDRKLAPRTRTPVAVGEAIELGEVMLVVRGNNAPVRPRRMWPHGYFEGRVEEQCARGERSGESFAVLRLGIATPPVSGAIEEAFSLGLRALDVLALYAPGEYEVLLVDTTADEASAVAKRLVAHIEQRGGRVNVGQAVYPRDGSTPEVLVARACDAVSGVGEPAPGGDAELQLGASPAMRSVHRFVEQVSASDISVLILGETGVGKEVLAETVHRLSPRHKRPFVKLHCASFSESLLESELFGHERGAFTGALQAKPGLLETAQGGTLLLDEIGELPLTMQVKLLRVLEERKVLRIGALTPRSIDVRFIAATNRDLEVEVQRGRFRLDLYYRLNGMTLMIPPLRERPEEIESLTQLFIRQACARMQRRDLPQLAPEAMARLLAYSWPGNIRELRNTVERAVLLCGRDQIGVAHLPTEKMGATLPTVLRRPGGLGRDVENVPGDAAFDVDAATVRFDKAALASNEAPAAGGALHERIDALERSQILEALEQCAGNQTRAAKLLGISRGKLVARLDAYGIARPRK